MLLTGSKQMASPSDFVARTRQGRILLVAVSMLFQEMPVQGEVAFDPFAMMDEQPDSAYTTARSSAERRDEDRRRGLVRGSQWFAGCEVHLRPEPGAKPNWRPFAFNDWLF